MSAASTLLGINATSESSESLRTPSTLNLCNATATSMPGSFIVPKCSTNSACQISKLSSNWPNSARITSSKTKLDSVAAGNTTSLFSSPASTLEVKAPLTLSTTRMTRLDPCRFINSGKANGALSGLEFNTLKATISSPLRSPRVS